MQKMPCRWFVTGLPHSNAFARTTGCLPNVKLENLLWNELYNELIYNPTILLAHRL